VEAAVVDTAAAAEADMASATAAHDGTNRT